MQVSTVYKHTWNYISSFKDCGSKLRRRGPLCVHTFKSITCVHAFERFLNLIKEDKTDRRKRKDPPPPKKKT